MILYVRRNTFPTIALLLILLCCPSCSYLSVDDVENNQQLVILSYNIHHGEGMDGKIDLERIARVIRSASPDLVSLQEVDRNTIRSGGVDQIQELARLVEMEYVFGAAMDWGGGKYGNAILSRFPIKQWSTHPLPGEPRRALVATVEISASRNSPASFTFDFIATHLDTQRQPRLDAVPLIENIFRSASLRPAVLAGDLNATPDSPTMRGLGEHWHNATSAEEFFTSPVKSPSRQIDYILYRPADCWKVIGIKVLEEQVASDHRPIMAVLEWRKAH